MLAIPFPVIDPVLIQIGPFAIRWYALAYVVGILVGWRYMLYLAKQSPKILTREQIDDLVVWITLGVVLGGRIGYVLFYRPGYYLENPLAILTVWQGGMAFHGGMLGVIVAVYWFSRRRGVDWLRVGDLLVCTIPIGLFLGRVANFINGELFGRVTDVPWAMVFPHGGDQPRHPSQLYEAALEGLVLFALLYVLVRYGRILERPGRASGVFLAGYAAARIFVEFFRQPDAHLGFLYAGATMGQLLSLPVLIAGLYLLARPLRRA
jgi:phosphatidylglycerol---prolipoprotein diacylglyceryl transferase